MKTSDNKYQYPYYIANIKNKINNFLVNSYAIHLLRKFLRRIPMLQELAGYWQYLFKKRLLQNKYAQAAQANDQLNRATFIKPQLLIDVSGIVIHDTRTGIQRVTRSVLQELLLHPPEGFVVEPVYSDASGIFRYARQYERMMLHTGNIDQIEEPIITVNSGDIFYCPDSYVPYPFAMLNKLQQQGLSIIMTIYDLIPVQYGALYPKALTVGFSDWLEGVMRIADGVVCDSKAVTEEVKQWLIKHPGERQRSLPIGYFHLGSDIESSIPSQGPEGEGENLLLACDLRPTLLMVGTLEPRKGHAQAVAAVESLWKAGIDINLIIIGKEGWRTQFLARKLLRHEERDQRLFWMEGASDALLLRLYSNASALLAASLAEGFGLPLIEAAHHGLPIIARDIPVFREVASEHAFYFTGESTESLSTAIRQWLILHDQGNEPNSRGITFLSWEESSRQLISVIIRNKWTFIWNQQ